MKRLTSNAFKKLVGRYFGGLIKRFNNLISNGNFANGTTGGSASGYGINAANNEITGTGLGTGASPNITGGNSGNTIPSGNKIYVSAYIYPPEGCTSIDLNFRDSTINFTVTAQTLSSPVAGAYVLLSGIVTLLQTSTYPRTQIITRFPDAATSNGKVVKTKQIIQYDVTNHPAAEQTTAWCDANIAPYIIY